MVDQNSQLGLQNKIRSANPRRHCERWLTKTRTHHHVAYMPTILRLKSGFIAGCVGGGHAAHSTISMEARLDPWYRVFLKTANQIFACSIDDPFACYNPQIHPSVAQWRRPIKHRANKACGSCSTGCLEVGQSLNRRCLIVVFY